MRLTGVRLLVIDEVHNVLVVHATSSAASSTFYVGSATNCKFRLWRLAPQKRCVRFRVMTNLPTVLSLWRCLRGATAKNIAGCSTLWRQYCHCAARQGLRNQIWRGRSSLAAEGILGEIVVIVTRAAVRAVSSGSR